MKWLQRNVPLLGPQKLSPWRNLALSAWPSISDASVNSVIELEAAPLLRYLERESQRTGTRVTVVHAVGKAAANTMKALPAINCLLRLGRLYRRRDVDIFFPVALDREGEDLSGVTLRNVDAMSTVEIAEAMSRESQQVRHHGDSDFKEIRGHIFGRVLMRAAGFFLYTLNLWTPALGFPRDAFGSMAVTDLSQFGAAFAFPPLLPIARLPIVVGIMPLVERFDARGSASQWLRLCVVFDHRVIDGVYAGRLSALFKRILGDPEAHLGAPATTEDRPGAQPTAARG